MPEDNHCITSPVVLGNPARSRLTILYGWDSEPLEILERASSFSSHQISHMQVSTDDHGRDHHDYPESGTSVFSHKEDQERYGTGNIIIVNYVWNEEESRCIENEILMNESRLGRVTLKNEIFHKIPTLLPVTVLDIKTVNGNLMVSQRTTQTTVTYLRIPNPGPLDLIPRIPYSDLRKNSVTMSPHVNIEIVTRDSDSDETWYVFKRCDIPIDIVTGSMEALLSEVENLSHVQSQYMIKPSFIITEKDDDDLFVGYLMPFMPAGSLEHVFLQLIDNESVAPEPMLLHPKFARFSTSEEWSKQEEVAPLPTIKPLNPKLAWSLKHTWAIEATSALVSLHEIGVYSAKIRLPHVLLGRDGHLKMCSIGPMDRFPEWDPYRSPEFDFLLTKMMFWPSPTAGTDVYALGVVLWQIAEEVARIEQHSELHVSWRSGVPGSTPQWYQDLVSRCLDSEPLNRPSAKQVLEMLENQHEAKA